MSLQIKNLSGNNVPEYKVQEVKRSKLILLHYGIFKIGWDWMILLCTFYIAVTVPYNAVFELETTAPSERPSIVSDVIVEMLLIIGKSSVLFLVPVLGVLGVLGVRFTYFLSCIYFRCLGIRNLTVGISALILAIARRMCVCIL